MPVKQKEKPNPPKRALAPFFLFKQDVYDQVKKENPDKPITELTKIIAQKWAKVDPTKKKDYEKLFEEGKKKYEKEKAEYESKYGAIERKKKKKRAK